MNVELEKTPQKTVSYYNMNPNFNIVYSDSRSIFVSRIWKTLIENTNSGKNFITLIIQLLTANDFNKWISDLMKRFIAALNVTAIKHKKHRQKIVGYIS